MTDLIFNEWYGYITIEQSKVYKQYGVSAADHDFLCYEIGEDNRTAIIDAVKQRSNSGYYKREFIY
jgi:hypothetical protein